MLEYYPTAFKIDYAPSTSLLTPQLINSDLKRRFEAKYIQAFVRFEAICEKTIKISFLDGLLIITCHITCFIYLFIYFFKLTINTKRNFKYNFRYIVDFYAISS